MNVHRPRTVKLAALAIAVVLFVACRATPARCDPRFDASFTLYWMPGPASVAVADIDGDGHQDLAVAMSSPLNRLVLMRGDGNGAFTAVDTLTMSGSGTLFNEVAAADLDSDGDIDLVAGGSGALCLFLSNGGFDFPSEQVFGSSNGGLRIGNVTGSPAPDLVVSANDPNAVRIFPGLGNGSFGAAFDLALNASPIAIALGDLDGDLDLDIVANPCQGALPCSLAVFENLSGSFASPVTIRADSARGIAIADLTGDGHPDLLAGATLLRGFVQLAFGNAVVIGGEANYRDPLVADLDGDLVPDFLATPYTYLGTFGTRMFHGLGSGAFSPATVIPCPSATGAVGDFDEDGSVDLVMAGLATGGYVACLKGNGDGSFGIQRHFASGGPTQLLVADFGGDAIPDVILRNAATSLEIHPGLGNGSLGAPSAIPTPFAPADLAIGDFDGNGILDLAVANSGSASFSTCLGMAGGAFASWVTRPLSSSAGHVCVHDMNGDDRDDVVVSNGTSISIALADVAGAFPATTAYACGGSFINGAAVGNLNGDAWPDVVALRYSPGRICVFPGVPGGLLGTRVDYVLPSSNDEFAALKLADTNGDGLDDVYLRTSSTRLGWYLTHSDGTLAAPTSSPLGRRLQDMVFADMDGDTRLDLVSANLGAGCATVSPGLGDGTFVKGLGHGATNWVFSVAVGDMNGDGLPDIVAGDDGINVLLQRGGTVSVPMRTRTSAISIASVWPNPVRRAVNVAFTLATDSPATLEMLDVTGRRVARQAVASPVPGTNAATFRLAAAPAAGVYWLRVSQGGAFASKRVVALP